MTHPAVQIRIFPCPTCQSPSVELEEIGTGGRDGTKVKVCLPPSTVVALASQLITIIRIADKAGTRTTRGLPLERQLWQEVSRLGGTWGTT